MSDDDISAATVDEGDARKIAEALSKVDSARRKVATITAASSAGFPATASIGSYQSLSFVLSSGQARAIAEAELAEAEAEARARGIRLVGDAAPSGDGIAEPEAAAA